MAHLRKVRKRYFLIDEKGRTHPCGTSKRVARKILDSYEEKRYARRSGLVEQPVTLWTLKHLKTRDLLQAKAEAKDVRTREKVWKAILACIPEDTRIDRITPLVIERLDRPELKRATVRRRYALLRYSLGEAVRVGEIAANPFARVKPLREWDARSARALTSEQWLRLCQHLDPETRSSCELQILTASRPGERGIETGDILYFAPHKRGAPRRFRLDGRLRKVWKSRRSFSRRSWDAAVEKLGIPIRPHDLRHTALTWAGKKPGASLVSLMKLGGWKSPAMAAKYLHPDQEPMETV